MAREDIIAGRMKQGRGKANDIAGAATGDGSRQAKGKIQKVVGKVQAKLGGAKKTASVRRRRRSPSAV